MLRARRSKWIACLGIGFLLWSRAAWQSISEHNVVVYQEPGRYAAWPANHGIWSWGNERSWSDFNPDISSGTPRTFTPSITTAPLRTYWRVAWMAGRHGQSKSIPTCSPLRERKKPGIPIEPGGKHDVDCPGGIDFLNPAFILTARFSDADTGPTRFYHSMNRGGTWEGPYPTFPF